MNEPIPPDMHATLERYHFDRIPFDSLRARVSSTRPLEQMHMIDHAVAPPDPAAVPVLPAPGTAERVDLDREGRAAIERGELAVLILAGGMATRFGSSVKALAPVFADRSERFLDIKLADVAHHSPGGQVDTTLMTSFATHDAIARELPQGIHCAPQFVSLRLREDGSLFRTSHGTPSLYAPGHGDVPDAMEVSGALARLRARGAKTVLVSNVDNVAATIEPALFAMHRRGRAAITVELVAKRKGDKGGLPVVHDGKWVLAEAFRLPKDFPHDSFPLFNTNTLWIDVAAMDGDFPWTWCVARKQVDGHEAIQLERLVGEMTWWRSTQYVSVPRDGSASRFIPIKDQDDLREARPQIAELLRQRLPAARS